MINQTRYSERHLKDLPLLLKAAVEIANSLTGQKLPEGNVRIKFGEGLGRKIITHTMSAFYLSQGYHIGIGLNVFQGSVDFSSTSILARASLEGYLAFNYVFASCKDEEESVFRFLCWDLGGYLDRENFPATVDEHLEIKKSEAKAIKRIQVELQQTNRFMLLNSKDKKLALNGRWRLSKSWSDLAVQAGFTREFFDLHYSFLCSHSHSSRLSVIQIQQCKDTDSQLQMGKASAGLLIGILAKFLFDYINLIPQLHSYKLDSAKMNLIIFWKAIFEEM